MGWITNIIHCWRGGYKETLPTFPPPSIQTKNSRISIVDGGLAGMVAATVLTERGCSVTQYGATISETDRFLTHLLQPDSC